MQIVNGFHLNLSQTRNMIFSISKSLHSVHFIDQIKYYKFNSVQTVTSFKILKDVTVCIWLYLWNKIRIMKWTKCRNFEMESVIFRQTLSYHLPLTTCHINNCEILCLDQNTSKPINQYHTSNLKPSRLHRSS